MEVTKGQKGRVISAAREVGLLKMVTLIVLNVED